MCVTGIIHPKKIAATNAAKAGDKLVLSKPLGVGVLTTAVKRELRTEAQIEAAIHCMAALNRPGGEAVMEVGASAATDVTGFGLGGHLVQAAKAGKVGMKLNFDALPVLPEVMDLLKQKCFPGGTKKNWLFFKQDIDFAADLTDEEQLLVCDAQTSGGMVISVPADKCDAMIASLKKHGALAHAVIGEVVADHPGRISVIR